MKKIALGLCAKCGSPELVPEKKLCQRCYQAACANLSGASLTKRTEIFRQKNNAFWSEKQANAKKKGAK